MRIAQLVVAPVTRSLVGRCVERPSAADSDRPARGGFWSTRAAFVDEVARSRSTLMILLSRRSLLAIAAVVDIALHARPSPVAAKALAARHNLPPRHLETVLQALVRARHPERRARAARRLRAGPRAPAHHGGRHRARRHDRRRARTALPPLPDSSLVDKVVGPSVAQGGRAFLSDLDVSRSRTSAATPRQARPSTTPRRPISRSRMSRFSPIIDTERELL